MDQLSYSAEWLSRWREEITQAVSSMLLTFEEKNGYEPGMNEVRIASKEDLRAVPWIGARPMPSPGGRARPRGPLVVPGATLETFVAGSDGERFVMLIQVQDD